MGRKRLYIVGAGGRQGADAIAGGADATGGGADLWERGGNATCRGGNGKSQGVDMSGGTI
jgi:hypothetical protein